MPDSTVERLKIEVVAETNKAERNIDSLKKRVDGLTGSLGSGIPGGGKSGISSATTAKGLNQATQILSGSLGGVVGQLSALGPQGAAAAAAIALITASINQACQASQEYIKYTTQLLSRIEMGTSAMKEFNSELTKTARNSSVSKTDLGQFFSATKTSFSDSSQMERDAEFAKQLISYYGDVNTAAQAYNRILAMDLDTQKQIHEYMQMQYNLTQDTGEAGLKAIKQELSQILSTLGSIALQALNPIIQAIKVVLSITNSILGVVKEVFQAFSGLTGGGTMADALSKGAEEADEAASAMDRLNDEMALYNGQLSGLDEVSTVDSSNGYGLADNSALDDFMSQLEDTSKGSSALTGPFEAVYDYVQKAFDILDKFISPVLNVIKTVIDSIRDALGGIVDEGSGLLDDIIEPISEIVDTVISMISGVLQPVIQTISKALSTVTSVLSRILGFVSDIVGSALGILTKVLDPVMDILDEVFGILSDIFDSVFGSLQEALDPVSDILDIVLSIFDVLIESIEPVLDVIIGVVKSLFTFITPIVDILKDIFQDYLTPILDIISKIVSAVKDKLASAFGFLKTVIEGVVSVFKTIFNVIIDGVNFFIRGINAITEGLSSVWDWTGLPSIPKIPEIKHLATGGSAVAGELVRIRESGPELVSYNAGKMEVMNNDQIIAAVSQGVASALQDSDFGSGDVRLIVDGYEMHTRLEKARQRAGSRNLGSKSHSGGY